MPGQRVPDTLEPKLSALQRSFLSLYLGRCAGNAVEAARLAGISEDENVLRQTAKRLLNNPAVRYHIEKWTSRHMAPMEILALFASHARGDQGDFWDIPDDPGEPPVLNLRKAAELGITRLIKKLKVSKDGTTELELYPADNAARELAKIAQMYKSESSVNVTVQHVLRAMPPEVRERALASLSARLGHALAGGNEGGDDGSDDVIEAEITSDPTEALTLWKEAEPLIHGLGDSDEDDEDKDD